MRWLILRFFLRLFIRVARRSVDEVDQLVHIQIATVSRNHFGTRDVLFRSFFRSLFRLDFRSVDRRGERRHIDRRRFETTGCDVVNRNACGGHCHKSTTTQTNLLERRKSEMFFQNSESFLAMPRIATVGI